MHKHPKQAQANFFAQNCQVQFTIHASRSIPFPILPLVFGLCYVNAMSATQVIEEIKHLPPAEQSRVLRFAFELARERQLSGETLSELAQRMADSNDPTEKKRLREEIRRGFYGNCECN
jgi:hypothetical protein